MSAGVPERTGAGAPQQNQAAAAATPDDPPPTGFRPQERLLGTTEIVSTYISSNTADVRGGGIYNDLTVPLTVTNSTLNRNSASAIAQPGPTNRLSASSR